MIAPETMTERQKTLALLTLIVALVLEIIDTTIVNTALPQIKAGLRTNGEEAQWIVAGYSLAFALLLMAGGRLGDSYGYRRMFLIGVTGFSVASLGCGLATSGTHLVIARLLQGATGAMMAPQAMAMMQVLFAPLERVSKMALFGVIGGLAAIAGPIIGGLLLQADIFGLGWRVLFLINLPVGILAVIAGRAFLPSARSSHPAGNDYGGIALFGAAMAGLLWPLMRAETHGLNALAWTSLVAVPLFGWAGWRHVSARVASGRPALFAPALFTVRSFRLGLTMSISASAANGGFLLVLAFALQSERGLSALATGLYHMPFGLGVMLGIGFLGRKLLPRIGRWILVIGAGLMATSGTFALAGVTAMGLSDLWLAPWLVPWLVLCGAGMGMTSGCIGPVTLAQVDRGHAGAASALLKTAQQLGIALGVALVGSIYFAVASAGMAAPSLAAALAVDALLAICLLAALRLPGNIFAAH